MPMDTVSHFDPTRLSIMRITIAKASIEASDEYLRSPAPPHTTGLIFNPDLGFDYENKAARAHLTIDMEGLTADQKPLGLKACYKVVADFKVENLDECVRRTDGIPVVDGQLAIAIMSILYSTMRGMILERTAGTFFNGVMLPVINPKMLTPQPVANG